METILREQVENMSWGNNLMISWSPVGEQIIQKLGNITRSIIMFRLIFGVKYSIWYLKYLG